MEPTEVTSDSAVISSDPSTGTLKTDAWWEKELPGYEPLVWRSVSQRNLMLRCPYAFKLQRIDKVWERPAAWTPMGSAVHEAAEAWEKSGRTMSPLEAQDVFTTSYVAHTNAQLADTPNAAYWFASGPYQGPEDIQRRYNIGLDHVARYIEYYTEQAPREVVWITPDGTPAIELAFEVYLGDVPVRGIIDTVIDHPKLDLMVDDTKTGRLPGDSFQLGTYAVAVNKLHGTDIRTGSYFMTRAGKPTVPYDLSEWTEEAVTEEFARVDAEIKAENFEPKPGDICRFCSVKDSCEYAAV